MCLYACLCFCSSDLCQCASPHGDQLKLSVYFKGVHVHAHYVTHIPTVGWTCCLEYDSLLLLLLLLHTAAIDITHGGVQG